METRFGKIREHIKDIISECAQIYLAISVSKQGMLEFEQCIQRAGIILNSACEDLENISIFIINE